MRKTPYIIIGIALLLFASCGRQQAAKSAVKDFVGQYLYEDVSYVDFTSVDSTRAISDSLIDVLHRQARPALGTPDYRPRTGRTLFVIRANYHVGDDTLSSTFYLNPDLDGIVAYKDNSTQIGR